MTAPALAVYQQGRGAVTADNLNTFVQSCDSVAQLRGFPGTPGLSVQTRGQVNPGDGLGGLYWWNTASTGTDNGSTIITPTGYATGAGRWLSVYQTAAGNISFTQATGYPQGSVGNHLNQNPYVTDAPYLADATGATDASAAITAASTAGGFRFGAGAYKIATNITISSFVTFAPGAVLNIQTGVTVTFSGGIDAGAYKIFNCTGTGAVVFTTSPPVAYAEWWGAVRNSSGSAATNSTAINAALVACQNVELLQADYYISATIKHFQPNGRLAGVSSLYNNVYGNRSTRLIMTNGATTTLQIGPDSNPGGINLFPEGIKCSGIEVTRSVAPTIAGDASAVKVQYVLEPSITDVRGDESLYGFRFVGTVHAILFNCSAKRSTAATGGTDFWRGFEVDGSSGIAAGGNASLYLCYCHADDTRASVVDGVGFRATGKFTDCFWIDCETVSCTVGMQVTGNSAVTNDFGNNDLKIIHPINDAFKVYGIDVKNLGVSANVEISLPYAGPASGALVALHIADAYGVVVTGGEMIMGAATTTTAIRIERCEGCVIDQTLISECTANAVIADTLIACRIAPVIKNKIATSVEAIYIYGTTVACKFDAIVTGSSTGFTYGYRVNGTADARNEYNCTGINSSSIVGGSANKLVRNSVPITVTGLTGTNLASGVMT